MRTTRRLLSALSGIRRHVDLVSRGRHPIYLDYPVEPSPRYGWGRPPHAGLERLLGRSRERCAELLGALTRFAPLLGAVPVSAPSDPHMPYWANGFIQGLDAVTLYAFPELFGSRRYVEIGSGNSTKFVRRAKDDHGLGLQIVSIDPHPRAEIDALCDSVVRRGLEGVSLDLFDALGSGDILMCDGSHCCLQGSDATVLFLDVLPRLRPGVLIYLDDIFLPHDYPPEWRERYYSEQYLLAVLLLADAGQRYEVLFPTYFASIDPELRELVDDFWRRTPVPGLEQPAGGNGFWLRVRA